METSLTWSTGGLAAVLSGDLTIGASAELTLGPGQIVKAWYGQSIYVDGTLTALGTAELPIVFWAIYAARNASPTMTDVTAGENAYDAYLVAAVTMDVDRTWNLTTMPMAISGDFRVAKDTMLTIEPGVVLKLSHGQDIRVSGTLDARGTLAQPIIITSYRDDSLFGDTWHDGDDAPLPGDWYRIYFDPDSVNSVLERVDIRYGGNYYSPSQPHGHAAAIEGHASGDIFLADAIGTGSLRATMP
jgi:hypothetical protein